MCAAPRSVAVVRELRYIYKSRQAQAAEEGKNLKLESHYFNSSTLALNSHSSSDSSLLACFFPNIVSGIESRVESTWMAHKSSRYSTQQHTNLSHRSLSLPLFRPTLSHNEPSVRYPQPTSHFFVYDVEFAFSSVQHEAPDSQPATPNPPTDSHSSVLCSIQFSTAVCCCRPTTNFHGK